MKNFRKISFFFLISVILLLPDNIFSQKISNDLDKALWIKEFEKIEGSPMIVVLDRDGKKEILVISY